MENEFEFDDSNLKSLEEFFSKEINSSLTPQKIMIISLVLNHVSNVLSLYNQYSNLAIFDIKSFTAKHPEYADIDFHNLKDIDEDTMKAIGDSFRDEDGKEGEEFSKGDILLNNVIKVMLDISVKLYDSYTKEYSKQIPEDTEQFFTVLDNCLQNTLMLLKAFFTHGSSPF
jgi:hypothetical protein